MTAVEWLVEQLIQRIDFTPMSKWDVVNNIIDQAKAIEKQQIMDAYAKGSNDRLKNIVIDYYNETYGD